MWPIEGRKLADKVEESDRGFRSLPNDRGTPVSARMTLRMWQEDEPDPSDPREKHQQESNDAGNQKQPPDKSEY